MKLRNQTFNLFLGGALILLWGCGGSPDPTGEWEFPSIERQYLQYSAVGQLVMGINENLVTDELAKEDEEYEDLSIMEGALMKTMLLTEMAEQLREEMEEQIHGTYLGLYADSSVAIYMYPYTFGGHWLWKSDTLTLDIKRMSSLTDAELPAPFRIRMAADISKSKMELTVVGDPLPGFWQLQTMKVTRQKESAKYRMATYNAWRYPLLPIRLRVRSHIAYLTWYFQDGIETGAYQLEPNREVHCSPLQFYGNGYKLKAMDSEEITCWKNTFATEAEFVEAYQLLEFGIRQARRNRTATFDTENRFNLQLGLLQKLLQEI